jgi:ribose transport system substrate-binding protein
MRRYTIVLTSLAASFAATALAGLGTASAQTSGEAALASVARATGPTDHWYGPKTSPTPAAGQSVVCVQYMAQDISSASWCRGVTEGAAKLGWKATVIDGQGTADGQRRALQQAIALQPNGIVLASVDAQSNVGLLKEASDAGIKIVGIHSVAGPGPAPKVHLFTNITCDPVAQGTLAADYAIAHSHGTAQLIAVTDTQYAIARAKADAAQAAIKTCPNCKMLEYVSTPVGTTNQIMPGLFTSWIQKYPEPFYVYTVSDAGFFDPGVPALRTGGVPHGGRIALIGSDGSPSAYLRIRTGQYEVATIPEPAIFQGWQAIDELNRAIKGAPPSGFNQPLHIITKDNLATDINADGIYEPKVDYRSEYAKIWNRN